MPVEHLEERYEDSASVNPPTQSS